MTLLSVCRLTPRTSAPWVTERPKASRQALRILRPGCGGFFIGMGLFLLSLNGNRSVQRQKHRYLRIEKRSANWPAPSPPKTPSGRLSGGASDNQEGSWPVAFPLHRAERECPLPFRSGRV